MRTLVWFRGKDLRLADHAPLNDALARGSEVIPLFVVDPYFFDPIRAAELPHRMQFLVESLTVLAENISRLGSRLLLAHGKSIEVVPELARALRADRVVAQRWVEPFARERDRRIQAALDVPFTLFEGETLNPPGALRNSAGQPYRVFSAYAHAYHVPDESPISTPTALPPLPDDVRALGPGRAPFRALPELAELGLARNPRLVPAGEQAAQARLSRFLRGAGKRYDVDRDRLDLPGTSRLSQDLKFGLLSPRSVWTAAAAALEAQPRALASFQNELLWREFSHALLWHDPELLERPFNRDFETFPWRRDEHEVRAWCEGRTGYPIVDATLRQLLEEGFVPNRGRMIAASFLTKHLFTDYRLGEAHYLKYLTDGDWAQNNLGWQWSAGCGPDAQPYFRVFNPLLQARRFDPDGSYVRRWLPELSGLTGSALHAPWTASADLLRAAGVELGKSYPMPIVEHRGARERFLARATGWSNKR